MKKQKKLPHLSPLFADRGPDFIWATLTILAFPVGALSLTAMGLHPILAFFSGALLTFSVIIIEAIVRGKLWFLQDRFKEVIGHEHTAFRILIVAGALLLILQSFLIVEAIRNPRLDSLMLDLIIRKQCVHPETPIADLICPLFSSTQQASSDFFLYHSLEQSAKDHLLPGGFGDCAVLPLSNFPYSGQGVFTMKFAARCIPWDENNKQMPLMDIIEAQFSPDTQGFYRPTVWDSVQKDREYYEVISDPSVILPLDQLLRRRYEAMLRLYAL